MSAGGEGSGRGWEDGGRAPMLPAGVLVTVGNDGENGDRHEHPWFSTHDCLRLAKIPGLDVLLDL